MGSIRHFISVWQTLTNKCGALDLIRIFMHAIREHPESNRSNGSKNGNAPQRPGSAIVNDTDEAGNNA